MTKQDYFDIIELANCIFRIGKYIDNVNTILEEYYPAKDMTLKEVQEFLWSRRTTLNQELQKQLNVQ